MALDRLLNKTLEDKIVDAIKTECKKEIDDVSVVIKGLVRQEIRVTIKRVMPHLREIVGHELDALLRANIKDAVVEEMARRAKAELARIGRGEYDSVWDRGDLTEYEEPLRAVLDRIRRDALDSVGMQKDEVAQQVELNVARMIAERTEPA